MLSRQQIRERKRQLAKEEKQKQERQTSLAELNDAERQIEQRRNNRDQLSLQTGSLCVAILSQIPEHRAGIDTIVDKAIKFIDELLDTRTELIATVEEPDDDEEDEDEEDDEPLAEAV